MANYLAVKEQGDRTLSLVSEKEVLRLKKNNYGAYYLQPKDFDRRLKQIESTLHTYDAPFQRERKDQVKSLSNTIKAADGY